MTELTTQSGVRVELPWDESEPADWNDWLYANFDKKGKGDSGEPYSESEVIYLIKTAVSQIEVLIPLPTGTRTTDDTGAIMSNDFKDLVHGWCDEHGAPQFEDEDCRVGHRLKWIAENRMSGRLTPQPGPPDLEGVPDDALFVVYKETNGYPFRATETASELMTKWADIAFAEIKWHIPLGVITPPEPEPQNPKCPVCGGEMSKPIRCGSMSRHFMKYRVECFDNSRSVEHAVAFYGSTAAEALEAARKAGE